ncbi:MAG TPA: TlpA disulfide reductase family protein [Bryobacteraceae bacterium]|nr:TlpA disulfide reductase family protein [Bryobacteraceae bacterium]
MRTLAILLTAALLAPAANEYSNRRAPGFSLPDYKYEQHDPQDYRGKVLLVDIMLTTCPTCNQLADTLVSLKKKYGDKLGIISVVSLPDSMADTKSFAAKHGVDWPIVFDSGQVIASYMKVTPANPTVHFPHLFVIDGQGMIRNDFGTADEDSLTVDKLSAVIDQALASTHR